MRRLEAMPRRKQHVDHAQPAAYNRRSYAYPPDVVSQVLVDKFTGQLTGKEISDRRGPSLRTIAYWKRNISRYGSAHAPLLRKLGRGRELTVADEEALEEELRQCGWLLQDEMKYWLQVNRGVEVSQPTISRLIKRRDRSRKKLYAISRARDDDLREVYQRLMRRYDPKYVVFLDESMFNERTGLRARGYAPIGEEARYKTDITRGGSHSLLAALAIDGYLSCTSVRRPLRWMKTVPKLKPTL